MIELSVLIPVWRSRPINLLNTLWLQAEALDFPIELWVCDDSADPSFFDWHDAFRGHPGIRILSFTENLGRSRARNMLLSKANGQWVLWLDGDLEIPPDFLKPYQMFVQAKENEPSKLGPVICGGIRVTPNTAFVGGIEDAAGEGVDRLRYRYAAQIEDTPAAERQKAPYRWVRAAHCLLPTLAARSLSFPEFLHGYGHEDTHWAMQIQAQGMLVQHWDHPVDHCGIDSDAVFLEKTRQAVQNLARLWRYDPLFARFGKEISLIRAHDLLQMTGFMFFLALFSPWFEGRLRKQRSISLRFFVLIKLVWFDRALRTARPFQKVGEGS